MNELGDGTSHHFPIHSVPTGGIGGDASDYPLQKLLRSKQSGGIPVAPSLTAIIRTGVISIATTSTNPSAAARILRAAKTPIRTFETFDRSTCLPS